MTISKDGKNAVINEWRELGFYYDKDDKKKTWLLVGSKVGLKRFCKLLSAYSSDSKNAEVLEHEHYGPYMYLKIMTSETADINGDCICGTLKDISNLATLVDNFVEKADVGDEISIGKEHAPDCEYIITIKVMNNDYDPSSSDPQVSR